MANRKLTKLKRKLTKLKRKLTKKMKQRKAIRAEYKKNTKISKKYSSLEYRSEWKDSDKALIKLEEQITFVTGNRETDVREHVGNIESLNQQIDMIDSAYEDRHMHKAVNSSLVCVVLTLIALITIGNINPVFGTVSYNWFTLMIASFTFFGFAMNAHGHVHAIKTKTITTKSFKTGENQTTKIYSRKGKKELKRIRGQMVEHVLNITEEKQKSFTVIAKRVHVISGNKFNKKKFSEADSEFIKSKCVQLANIANEWKVEQEMEEGPIKSWIGDNFRQG